MPYLETITSEPTLLSDRREMTAMESVAARADAFEGQMAKVCGDSSERMLVLEWKEKSVDDMAKMGAQLRRGPASTAAASSLGGSGRFASSSCWHRCGSRGKIGCKANSS